MNKTDAIEKAIQILKTNGNLENTICMKMKYRTIYYKSCERLY